MQKNTNNRRSKQPSPHWILYCIAVLVIILPVSLFFIIPNDFVASIVSTGAIVLGIVGGYWVKKGAAVAIRLLIIFLPLMLIGNAWVYFTEKSNNAYFDEYFATSIEPTAIYQALEEVGFECEPRISPRFSSPGSFRKNYGTLNQYDCRNPRYSQDIDITVYPSERAAAVSANSAINIPFMINRLSGEGCGYITDGSTFLITVDMDISFSRKRIVSLVIASTIIDILLIDLNTAGITGIIAAGHTEGIYCSHGYQRGWSY